MALAFRPHSATHKAVSAVTNTVGAVAGVVVGADRPSTTATILGQLDELTAREAFERYGIEEDRAGVWMCNPSDGDGIGLEDTLTIDGATWVVRGRKRINHGLALDHWEMMVVRVYA